MKFFKSGFSLTRDVLEELYFKDYLSFDEIGSRFGLTGSSVAYRFKKYGFVPFSQRDRNLNLAVKSGFPDLRLVDSDILRDEYNSSSLSFMGEKYGVSKTLIKSYFNDIGIDVLNKSERAVLGLPERLNDLQHSLLVGSILGDCSVSRSSNGYCRFSEHHSLRQKPYLDWKASIYGKFIKNIIPSDKRSVEGGVFKGFRMYSCSHKIFSEYYEMFYDDKKRLPKNFDELIDPFSLMVWYLDDGSVRNDYSIATTFEQSDIDVIIKVLKDKFGLEVVDKPRKQGDNLEIHILHFKDSDAFFNLIKDFFPSCMRYKVLKKHLFLLPEFSGFRFKAVEDFPEEYDESLLSEMVSYFKAVGFPYPSGDRSLNSVLSSLLGSETKPDDHVIKGNVIGNSFLLSVFDNFFEASQFGGSSAIEHFNNNTGHLIEDIYLKYKKKPTHSLMRSVAMEHGKISGFRPSIAKYICNTYCREGGFVLDPCGGWGGRMLGSYCSHVRGYDCVEASFKTFRNLRKLKTLLDRRVAKETRVFYSAFEDFAPDRKYDLVFTSPPYFKKEIYSDDDIQSFKRYEDYDSWKDGFLKPLVYKSKDVLNDGGYFIINIDDVIIGNELFPLKSDLMKICFGIFSKFDFLFMPYSNRYTRSLHGENIYIFQKQGFFAL